MDESFVQGIVGGVLNRHKDRTLDKKRSRIRQKNRLGQPAGAPRRVKALRRKKK